MEKKKIFKRNKSTLVQKGYGITLWAIFYMSGAVWLRFNNNHKVNKRCVLCSHTVDFTLLTSACQRGMLGQHEIASSFMQRKCWHWLER